MKMQFHFALRTARLAFVSVLGFLLLDSFFIFPARAQVTAFTYQGRLNDNSAPANGNYDLRRLTVGGIHAGPLTNGTRPAAKSYWLKK